MSNQEVLVNGGWIDLDTAAENGVNWKQLPFRYKSGPTYKEDAVARVEVGMMVVYSGAYDDFRGSWAMVQEIHGYDQSFPETYDLAFIGIDWSDDDDEGEVVQITNKLSYVKRNEFTLVPIPDLPLPPLKDGYYVSQDNGKAYSRKNDEWYYFDIASAFPWQKLASWTDANIRSTVTFLAPIGAGWDG